MIYDIIIIGAGPAGITSALYAKRANMNVLILYEGSSSLEKAQKIDNYYGFINGITGKELYNNGINQAKNLGIKIIKKEVVDIESIESEKYKIKVSDDFFETKSIIISTGNKEITPNIKGLDKLEGKGISYCAICDGFFYRNKNVVVIGNGEFAFNEANELSNIVNDVKILTNGMEKPVTDKYQIDIRKIKEIHGEKKVEYLEFEDGKILSVDGIFIALGIASGIDFAKKLGIIVKGKNIVVNERMETNVKGVFACGNITGGLLQVNKAVYEGAKAGIEATNYVKSLQK